MSRKGNNVLLPLYHMLNPSISQERLQICQKVLKLYIYTILVTPISRYSTRNLLGAIHKFCYANGGGVGVWPFSGSFSLVNQNFDRKCYKGGGGG